MRERKRDGCGETLPRADSIVPVSARDPVGQGYGPTQSSARVKCSTPFDECGDPSGSRLAATRFGPLDCGPNGGFRNRAGI